MSRHSTAVWWNQSRGVPAMIAEAPLGELEALLREVLDDLAEFGASEAMDVLKNRILSTMACHNAFRANRKWTRFCATWKKRSAQINAITAGRHGQRFP